MTARARIDRGAPDAPTGSHGERRPAPPTRRPVADEGGERAARWELAVLGIVVVALVWAVLRQLDVGLLLGHDEAAYATRARSWLEGTDTSSWYAHRSPGLPVLGVPVLAAGGGPTALRLVGLAFAVALTVGAWVLGRRLGGPVAGLVGAAAIAMAPPFLSHAAHFLTDLPAAALVVWLIVVVAREARRADRPGAGLLWAAPLIAGAVWLRMGAVLPVALVGLAAAVAWPSRVVAGWRWVLATLALAIGLLWLHFAGSIEGFGTPWGRILHTSRLTRTDTPGAALALYVRELPGPLAGLPAGLLMTVGAIGMPVLLVLRRRWDHRARLATVCWLVAVGHLVAMGITSEPEVRFVFLPLVLLAVLGGTVVSRMVAPAPRTVQAAVAVALTAVLVVVGAGPTTTTLVEDRRAADERYRAMEAAADAVVARSGRECAVATSYVPQLEWLTGCRVAAFDDPPSVESALDELAADDPYVLLLRDGKRQPTHADLEASPAPVTEVGRWDLADGRIGEAVLYRVD